MPAVESLSITDIIPRSREKILGVVSLFSTIEKTAIDKSFIRKNSPIVVYGAQEDVIATRSLWNHLSITYLGVAKRSQTGALEAASDIVYQVGDYSAQSRNVLEAISQFRELEFPTSADVEEMRRHYATFPLLAQFFDAQQSTKTGVWIKGAEHEARLIEAFKSARKLDNEELPDRLNTVARAHQARIHLWHNELEKVAEHPVVNELLLAIRDAG